MFANCPFGTLDAMSSSSRLVAGSATTGKRPRAAMSVPDAAARAATRGRRGFPLRRERLQRLSKQLFAPLGETRYGGQELKFSGDGFLALFEDPLPALACAQHLCGAVRDIGLEIRAGMHTGHVELRGDDVAGMVVNVAARVLALANDSEVLVTRTVKDLLAGSGPTFASRGIHELKGVPDAWELYAPQGSSG